MNCVIKIIAGPEAGQEFEVSLSEAVIGRSPRSLIRLSSPSVSYEHAVVSRAGEDFFIENLSANGTYLNNDRVTIKTRLRVKDQLRIGQETVARVESVPVSAGASAKRPLLIALVVGMLVVCGMLVILNPFASKISPNVSGAYATLQKFAAAKSDPRHGRLPASVPSLLSEGWRLYLAGDHKAAAAQFQDLYSLLQSTDHDHGYFTHFENDSAHTPTALQEMLAPNFKSDTLTEDDLGAALVEFADLMKRHEMSQ